MKRKYIAIEPIVSDERVCDSDREIYWADEVDQRIAELEAELQVERSARDKYERDFEYCWKTRVPDELLEWLIYKANYAGAWGDKYDHAEAILAKRLDKRRDI